MVKKVNIKHNDLIKKIIILRLVKLTTPIPPKDYEPSRFPLQPPPPPPQKSPPLNCIT